MVVKQKYIKVLFWALTFAVLFISSTPGSISDSIKNLDKLAHFFTFFLLSVLLLFAYKFSKPFFATALAMALFGLGIEVLHLYVPNRVFSWYDFAADVLGILAAFITYKIIYKKFELA